ncbi:rod-binding protein [Halovulum sp. GXIMD14794]
MSDHFSLQAMAPKTANTTRHEALRASASALEQSFLAEMLRHAGVARPPESGGGGAGEDAFSGFLADAYAEELTRAGGIGLADHIFEALVQGDEAQ